jgi:hypothetical protein
MTQPKRIDIAEFRRLGLLQEVNRQFFHPLGLALEAVIDNDHCQTCGAVVESTIHATGSRNPEIAKAAHAFAPTQRLGGIWDYRDYPEGISYGADVTSRPEWIADAERVAKMQRDRYESRTKALGYWIQPVRICRVCGCTDDDCLECIERTGEPCSWVEGDLCSACVEAIG